MESIKQAIERAKATEAAHETPLASAQGEGVPGAPFRPQEVRLNAAHLERQRIVAYGSNTSAGRYYDMLRTQVLQEMDKAGWQFIAVTSPTPGCGKTVTACNLALSIARLPERAAMIVDLDMHKPKVAEYLGCRGRSNLLDVLEDRVSLRQASVEATIGPNEVLVVPGAEASGSAPEWLASQTMASILQSIKRDFRSRVVIFDLPPLLIGDDVISILPRMDCVLLVLGAGQSSPSDLREAQKHIPAAKLLRVVVNKVSDPGDAYYGYSYRS